jgi:catechol 2,3-dioxygenase-like lactoylglutathione lyase family enzyme
MLDLFAVLETTFQRSRAMINGAHVIIYSRDAEADRAFMRDVLKFRYVDVHGGWLIFKLPPSEVAVHPSDENDLHEFYLMTDDLEIEIRALQKAGARCDAISQQSWGRATRIQLPGGGALGLYEPRHERPQ